MMKERNKTTAVLRLKDGSIKKHNVNDPDQIRVIEFSFGKVIRVAPIDSKKAFYYDFNILDKIECK